ncbi:MAG: MG2 domain-containing protein [Thermodesulfobacteriota bacterium]
MKRDAQMRLLMGCLALCVLVVSPIPGWGSELDVSGHRDMSITLAQEELWGYRLRFNYPVFPKELTAAISAKGNEVPVEVEIRDPQTNVAPTGALSDFRVVSRKKDKSQGLLQITVARGLSDATGRWVLARDRTFAFWSQEKIQLTSLRAFYHSKTDKGLLLNVSAPVSEEDLRRAIKISPEVPGLSVSKNYEYGCKIGGDFKAGQKYELTISAVKAEKWPGVFQEASFPFQGPGLQPSVGFRSSRSVVELRGRQLLPVTLTNVSKTRCVLKRVPPIFVPEVAPGRYPVAIVGTRHTERFRGDDLDRQQALQPPPPAPPIQTEARTKLLKTLTDGGAVSKSYLVPFSDEAEVFFAPEATDHTIGYSLPLSFRKNPEHGGAWLVTFEDADGTFKSASGLIQVTDLSLTYKRAVKSILFWVTALHTGDPVAGVEVMVTAEDGTKFFVGKTSPEGLLHIKDATEFPALAGSDPSAKPKKAKIEVSKLTWAVAVTGTDSCAMDLGADHLKALGLKQTDKPQKSPETGNGRVFTERGIYRPGETVFFKLVQRTYKDHKIVPIQGKKAKIEITGPRQDVIYNKELSVNEFGSCHDSVPIKGFFPVGTYTLVADMGGPAGRVERYSTTFLVAEFKRPRHFVSIDTKLASRKSKDYVKLDRDETYLSVDVAGKYYTGGPVKHAKVRWKATLVPVTNQVKGIEGYSFGNEDTKELFTESGESILDKNGTLQLAIPVDARLLTGLYGVSVSATVLDVDGEPATDVTTFNPKPKFLVGVSNHPQQVAMGYKGTLRVVVVGADGKPLKTGEVKAEFMHQQEWSTYKRDDEGNINYAYEEGWVKGLGSTQRIVDGHAAFDVEFNEYGQHMVVFTYSDKDGNYTSQTVFQVGWDAYQSWVTAKRREGVVTGDAVFLAMRKDEYAVGEQVEVEFNTRRPVNKCLVTLELDDIISYKLVDVKGTVGKYAFKTSEKFRPNVYVSVVAPAGRSGFPVHRSQVDTDVPMVYSGYADVKVQESVDKLKAEIAPEVKELKAKPGEETEIAFKVTDLKKKGVVAEMAVCVVDEAVLALTRFQTPVLSHLTDFDLPLSVFSGDLRLSLISQDLYRLFSTKPLTGGDGAGGAVLPSLRKDFRPVAYFNPAVVTNEKGEAKVRFKLPDTTTQYRVYAVVCDKGSGFDSVQRKMLVTKEFFVEPSVPRFLIPGDKIIFPSVVHNKTDAKGKFGLKVGGSKNLALMLTPPAGEIEPWSSSLVKTAAEVVGGEIEGVVRVDGKLTGPSGEFADAIEQTFPIHSRYLPVNVVTMGSFTKGTEIPVKLPDALRTMKPDALTSDDLQARVSLSITNWAKVAPGLKYLLHYPYGCIEQTSSGIIPLAGVRSLVKAGKVPGITLEQVDKYLGPGLNRLLSMQLANGGFSYWPGNLTPSWWGTLYATFAMSMLKHEAGYDVPQDRLDAAIKYLRENLFESKAGDRLHSYGWIRELAILNLALNGQLSESEFQSFFGGYDSLSDQGKAHLILGANKLNYLPKERLAALIAKLDPKLNLTFTNYTNSSYREIAVCLLAAAAVDTAREKQDTWAGYLLKGLKPEGRWYSTADTGWCLLALARYFQPKEATSLKPVKCRVAVKGKGSQEVVISEVPADVELDPQALLDDGKIKLETGSDTLVNYSVSLKYPDIVTDPTKLSNGFTLHKKVENLNGKDEIRVGDVLRITLEFQVPKSTTGGRWGNVEYLVLEDPVPAGVVPINTELATEAKIGPQQQPQEREYTGFNDMHPTHFEFRDDGVRVFKNRVWTGGHKYSYLARVVSEGDFWMRGSRVSLMYDPDVFGKTTGRKVKVLPAQ